MKYCKPTFIRKKFLRGIFLREQIVVGFCFFFYKATFFKSKLTLKILFQLPVIFKQIRESIGGMYSHSPDDAIFLLNKWDTLVLKHQKTDFFEKTKKKLCDVWPEAKADHILKFAAARVRLFYKLHTK